MSASRIAELIGKTPLLLHFDINRTIIQVDPAGGKSLVDILNNNVATECLGRVTEGKWQLVVGPGDAGRSHGGFAKEESDGLISFDDFVDSQFPKPPGMEALPSEEARAVWADISGKRRAQKKVFTEPGQPGEQFRPLVESQICGLTIPTGNAGAGRHYYIIPAFFKAVNALCAADVDFSLVFRTFGSDLREVLADWTRFVNGQHAYPCCEQAQKRFRDAALATAALFRDETGMYCSIGVDRSAPPKPMSSEESTLAYLKQREGYHDTQAMSYTELLGFIRTHTDAGDVLGLVDFYPWWAAHGESAVAGKVYPVHASPKAGDPFQVFFDDNAFPGDEHSILDVRDVSSGTPVLDRAKLEAYTVKVRPLLAISDEAYFLGAIEAKIVDQCRLRQGAGEGHSA